MTTPTTTTLTPPALRMPPTSKSGPGTRTSCPRCRSRRGTRGPALCRRRQAETCATGSATAIRPQSNNSLGPPRVLPRSRISAATTMTATSGAVSTTRELAAASVSTGLRAGSCRRRGITPPDKSSGSLRIINSGQPAATTEAKTSGGRGTTAVAVGGRSSGMAAEITAAAAAAGSWPGQRRIQRTSIRPTKRQR